MGTVYAWFLPDPAPATAQPVAEPATQPLVEDALPSASPPLPCAPETLEEALPP